MCVMDSLAANHVCATLQQFVQFSITSCKALSLRWQYHDLAGPIVNEEVKEYVQSVGGE